MVRAEIRQGFGVLVEKRPFVSSCTGAWPRQKNRLPVLHSTNHARQIPERPVAGVALPANHVDPETTPKTAYPAVTRNGKRAHDFGYRQPKGLAMASFSTHRGAPYPLTDGFVPIIANNGYRGPEPTLNGPSAGTDEGLESDVNVTFGTGFLDLCGRE